MHGSATWAAVMWTLILDNWVRFLTPASFVALSQSFKLSGLRFLHGVTMRLEWIDPWDALANSNCSIKS